MPAILVLTLFHVLMNVVAIVAGAGTHPPADRKR